MSSSSGTAVPTTYATIRCPRSSSGTPITATSSTAGCPSRTVSISPAPTRNPPDLIRSVDARPTMRCMPSLPITATSPVANQPSASQLSAVASGRFRYPDPTIGPRTCRSPTDSPSCGRSVAPESISLLRSRVSTPRSGIPTQPGRRSPSNRVDTVIMVSVMPYRSTISCPVSSRIVSNTGTGSGALPDTSSRAEESDCAAAGSAPMRVQTVGTPKNIDAPRAAASA